MPEKLSSKVIQQVYSICEGIVQNMINSVEDVKLKKQLKEVFEQAKVVFKGKIQVVNWFFEQSFKVEDPKPRALENLLLMFKHYYDYNLPEINNLPIVNYSLIDALGKFSEIEKKFQEGSNRIIAVDKVEDDVDEILVCSNPNFVWFDLGTTESAQESAAMGHCGADRCDALFSLREKKFIGKKHYGWEPHVTASYHHNGKRLSQVKGRENKKPIEKYQKFIMELFEEGIIRDFGGGSYLSQEDFGWSDVPENIVMNLINNKYPPDGLVYSVIKDDNINLMKEIVKGKIDIESPIPHFDFDPYIEYDDQDDDQREIEYRCFTPVKIAANLNSKKIMEFLITECDVDFEMEDDDDISVLDKVVFYKDASTLKFMLEKDANIIAEKEILVEIIESNWEEGLKVIINSDFDVNYGNGFLLCSYCHYSNRYDDVVKWLLDNGANVHVRDEAPLFLSMSRYACTSSTKISVIKCLLDHGANKNAPKIKEYLESNKVEKEVVELLKQYE